MGSPRSILSAFPTSARACRPCAIAAHPGSGDIVIVFDLLCRMAARRSRRGSARARISPVRERPAWCVARCGIGKVDKAPMAPRVPRKGAPRPLERLAEAQAQMLKDFAVGGRQVRRHREGDARGRSRAGDRPRQRHGRRSKIANRRRRPGLAAAVAGGAAEPAQLIARAPGFIRAAAGPVAQQDRATDSQSVGHWFESSRGHQQAEAYTLVIH